jgi:hypothetical protein
MNVQFAVKDQRVYVLEVNPRASRTVPFVSKATGVPLAKVAARVMAGERLAEMDLPADDREPQRFCVKEAVMPFGRFPGYLKLQINDFDQANQNVWGVGLAYDFARLGLRGLSATTLYAQGTNAVKPGTSEPVANLREGNFSLDYVAPARVLQGFTFSFQAAVGSKGEPRLENQFRIIVNYEIPAL